MGRSFDAAQPCGPVLPVVLHRHRHRRSSFGAKHTVDGSKQSTRQEKAGCQDIEKYRVRVTVLECGDLLRQLHGSGSEPIPTFDRYTAMMFLPSVLNITTSFMSFQERQLQ